MLQVSALILVKLSELNQICCCCKFYKHILWFFLFTGKKENKNHGKVQSSKEYFKLIWMMADSCCTTLTVHRVTFRSSCLQVSRHSNFFLNHQITTWDSCCCFHSANSDNLLKCNEMHSFFMFNDHNLQNVNNLLAKANKEQCLERTYLKVNSTQCQI